MQSPAVVSDWQLLSLIANIQAFARLFSPIGQTPGLRTRRQWRIRGGPLDPFWSDREFFG